MNTESEALRTLTTRPECADEVVDYFEPLAAEDADAATINDLSAAYFVRAQQDDQPSDLLRSLAEAERAVAIDPPLPEARFNLALVEETLGLTTAARTSWLTVEGADRSGWASEARDRIKQIDMRVARSAASTWPLNQERLPQAAASGDHVAIAALIRSFPSAAQRYVEEIVLPAWAQASLDRNTDAVRQRLNEAQAVASELATLTGDRYLLESVELIRHSDGARLKVLREAHLAFAQARLHDRARELAPAAEAYRAAAAGFAKAGSPLRAGADLGLALQLAFITRDTPALMEKLVSLEPEAREHGYGNLWGRILSNRAFLLQTEGRYVESLALYEEALRIFQRNNDEENLANVHTRKAGILRLLGQDEIAWREAYLALRYAPRVVEVQSRHHLVGEAAAIALALGFPATALRLQSSAVEMLQDALAHEPHKSAERIKELQFNLGIALRARADIRLYLGQLDQALAELDQANGFARIQADDDTRDALRARIAEVNGQIALPTNPQRAVAAFTEALTLTPPGRFRTFRAILFSRRADAHRRAGHPREAQLDLRTAIDEITAEETEILSRRRRGQGERLWTAYFSRFQETYQRLIAQMVEDGKSRDAFAFAERARAIEPLSLVLELPIVPSAFQHLDTRTAQTLSLDEIRLRLPEDTCLVEYQVQEDRTFVWLVSRDDFQPLSLPVGRKTVEGWTRGLQSAASNRDTAGFLRRIETPFSALLEKPLQTLAARRMWRGTNRRLVVVPDQFTNGLPFAALRDARTRRYLVQDYTVSVAASATLYIYSLERDHDLASARGMGEALLVGDPAFDSELELTRGLDRLPHAIEEVKRIREFYTPRVEVLVDKDATVPALLKLARESTIVHVAGHAIANRHAPFGTLLLLAPSKNHSGVLYTDELLTKLHLDGTRLVVLSACSSAGGVPIGPEGLAPLVRPFIASGVPAVVGSLWTIGDASSEELLVEFHRQYRDGHDAARALQLAQIRFLNEENAAMKSVLAWASFQVVGHASSPFPRSNVDQGRTAP